MLIAGPLQVKVFGLLANNLLVKNDGNLHTKQKTGFE